MVKSMDNLVMPKGLKPPKSVTKMANEFLGKFETLEYERGAGILLLHDTRSNGYYILCHLPSELIAPKLI